MMYRSRRILWELKISCLQRKILLIATGSSKAKAIYDSLYGPITPNVPASILQLHPDVTIVADEEALQLL